MHQSLCVGTVKGSGAGVSAGAGLNAHFNPAFAFSTAVDWAYGSFDSFQLDGPNVSGNAVNVMTTRVHVGFVWFPEA